MSLIYPILYRNRDLSLCTYLTCTNIFRTFCKQVMIQDIPKKPASCHQHQTDSVLVPNNCDCNCSSIHLFLDRYPNPNSLYPCRSSPSSRLPNRLDDHTLRLSDALADLCRNMARQNLTGIHPVVADSYTPQSDSYKLLHTERRVTVLVV
jgi:hypothetical protein